MCFSAFSRLSWGPGGEASGTGDLVSVAAGAYLYRSDRPQAGRLK